MAGDFELKPLSSGLGLGTVRSAKARKIDQNTPASPQAVHLAASKRAEPPKRLETPLPQPPRPTKPAPLDINPSLDLVSDRATPVDSPAPPTSEVRQHVAARAAYAPHSHGAALKQAPSARMFGWWVRALIGWGLDLFVVVVSTIICTIMGTLAWRLGQGLPDGADPYAAIADVINAGIDLGPLLVLALFVACYIFYYVAMRAVAGATLGGALRQS